MRGRRREEYKLDDKIKDDEEDNPRQSCAPGDEDHHDSVWKGDLDTPKRVDIQILA